MPDAVPERGNRKMSRARGVGALIFSRGARWEGGLKTDVVPFDVSTGCMPIEITAHRSPFAGVEVASSVEPRQ